MNEYAVLGEIRRLYSRQTPCPYSGFCTSLMYHQWCSGWNLPWKQVEWGLSHSSRKRASTLASKASAWDRFLFWVIVFFVIVSNSSLSFYSTSSRHPGVSLPFLITVYPSDGTESHRRHNPSSHWGDPTYFPFWQVAVWLPLSSHRS